jgi:hypothetical protein
MISIRYSAPISGALSGHVALNCLPRVKTLFVLSTVNSCSGLSRYKTLGF